jgi:cytidylate kinase
MSESIPVITIDGPSGSGKGTLSRQLAQQLGYRFLDSGALYRILALAARKHGIGLNQSATLAELAVDLDINFELSSQDGDRIVVEGQDVTLDVRTESCGNDASKVAALPQVREALLHRQRAFRRPPGLVADGRDMGTVVFPDAKVKIFLTAGHEERARRRHKQLNEQGISVSLDSLLNELAERDKRDANRGVAPLRPAEDAIIVDSTDLSVQQVYESALELVR